MSNITIQQSINWTIPEGYSDPRYNDFLSLVNTIDNTIIQADEIIIKVLLGILSRYTGIRNNETNEGKLRSIIYNNIADTMIKDDIDSSSDIDNKVEILLDTIRDELIDENKVLDKTKSYILTD